ncbi:putative quinol monooxygenase [Marinobacter sp. BGYM27]|uniref:putative quinol monooxygenase n=1 Tax=Marinobacter sp. BGYM27 TaxID=2975597 RepID=UPI0021A3096D|nr:putative quinol monooxygenase [Marinobacter sp. BGYM27]MDG5499380.1 putative quinol monooxygenase [Marinobacter sp. BGYM27]
MIVITAMMTATPGNGDALADAMIKIAVEVEKEAGNHCYLVHQSVDDADTVLIYEQYTDEDALAEHREHLKELGAGLKGLLAGRPDIKQFTLKG